MPVVAVVEVAPIVRCAAVDHSMIESTGYVVTAVRQANADDTTLSKIAFQN